MHGVLEIFGCSTRLRPSTETHQPVFASTLFSNIAEQQSTNFKVDDGRVAGGRTAAARATVVASARSIGAIGSFEFFKAFRRF